MEILWNICQKLIEGTSYITTFLTTEVGIRIAGLDLLVVTPIELLSIGGLCALALYYLIRGLTI